MKKQNKTLATVPGQQTTCRPSGRLRRTCERRCYYVLQVLPLVPRDSLFVFVLLHHLSELAMRRMLPSRNCSKMSRRLLNSNAQQQLRRTSPQTGNLTNKDRWSVFSSMELVALALKGKWICPGPEFGFLSIFARFWSSVLQVFLCNVRLMVKCLTTNLEKYTSSNFQHSTTF